MILQAATVCPHDGCQRQRSPARIQQTFLAPQWDVNNLPGYADETAGNPFVTFADIPVRARYQFLLDDAEYEISTFNPVASRASDWRADNPHPGRDELLTVSPQPAAVFGEHLELTRGAFLAG
jgi:hypothetical protein